MSLKNILLLGSLLLGALQGASATTYVVDSALDLAGSNDSNPGDNICEDVAGGSRCTLRAAIEEANAHTGADRIEFSVAATPLHMVINGSPLPTVTGLVEIDGRTAPGYNSSATDIRDAPPRIYIDGTNLSGTATADGLRFGNGSGVSSVYALGIVDFPDNGIEIVSGANVIRIDRTWIGVQADGDGEGNGTGILISGDNANVGRVTIAGMANGLGNVISSSDAYGVHILNGDGNVLGGNRIGTTADGLSSRSNSGGGVYVVGAGNLIGTTLGAVSLGNSIQFSGGVGVEVFSGDNRILGNEIISSTGAGIVVNGSGNDVGFTSAPQGNRVWSNGGIGIVLGDLTGASNTTVRSNDVFDNGDDGVRLFNGSLNTITGNQVDGNSGNGIRVDDDDNTVSGNTIGYTGDSPPTISSNAGNGIVVNGSRNTVNGNRVGGAVGASFEGIDVFSGDANVISNNRIGLSAAGFSVPNQAPGLRVDPSVTNLQITGNRIGFSLDGIRLEASGARVCGNFIGTDTSNQDFGNLSEGIRLLGDNNIIGSAADGCVANYLGYNDSDGVQVEGDSNTIADNYVGGVNNDSFPNGGGGVLLTAGAANNAVTDNTIANNGADGVRIGPLAGNGNRIQSNSMFANASGMGIDINDDGPTANDSLDADEGPNREQNTLEIINLVGNVATVTVEYRIDTDAANAAYPIAVDYYLADGNTTQGQTYLETEAYPMPGATQIDTVNVPGLSGSYLTATATDAAGNTSEFFPPIQFFLSAPPPDLIFSNGFE